MNGFKVILIYYLVYIILPLFSLYFFRDLYFPAYFIADITLASVIFIFGSLIIIYFISKNVSERNDYIIRKSSPENFYKYFSFPFKKYILYERYISIFLFFLAIGYFFYGSNTYRYGGSAISDQGNLFLILILRSIAFIYIVNFFRLFVLEHKKITTSKYLCGNAHSLFLISTNAGTADLLIGGFFLIITLIPKVSALFLTYPKTESELGFKNIIRLSFFGISPLLFIFTLLIGESMKSNTGYLLSFDELMLERELETIGMFMIFIVDFLSTHLYSLLNYIVHGIDYHTNVSIISEIYNNLLFRLNTVLGEPFTVVKPEISSVNRLNYLELDLDPTSVHEGTSPGFLGSSAMVFGKYWGFPIVILYSYFLIKTLSGIFYSNSYRINLAGAFIICHGLLWLFASPIDFLVLFDNSTVLLIFYLSFYFYCIESRSSSDSN